VLDLRDARAGAGGALHRQRQLDLALRRPFAQRRRGQPRDGRRPELLRQATVLVGIGRLG
jgi:hypothetical protein